MSGGLTKKTITLVTREFVALIRRFLSQVKGETLSVRRAIAVWAFGPPEWHAKFYRSFLKLAPLSATALTVPHALLKRAVRRFHRELVRLDHVIFLINDARIFFPETKGLSVYKISFYRRRLQREENYLTLFRMVNAAALVSKNWEEFRLRYRRAFTQLIRTNEFFGALARQMGHELCHFAKDTTRVVFVDAGLQATYALFLAECLQRRYPNLAIDIRLFCVYPWLAHLFRGRFAVTDARYVFTLERVSGRVVHRSDILDKTSGTFVGFAVGSSLGYPTARMTEEDFLALHGKKVDGLTDVPAHPFFHRVGDYTDDMRLFLGVVHDLLREGRYDVRARVASLKQWARACASQQSFARIPCRTTLESALRLLQGESPKRSGSRTTEFSACVYRVIPIGLFFTQPKDIVAYAEQEAALTHNTPMSKAGSVFTALFVRFLCDNEDPVIAARRALAILEKRYGRSVRRLTRQLYRAAANDVPIQDAVTFFGTSMRVYETLPLAFYYFLQFQNTFKTPVLLAANTFRRDSSQEKQRLAAYSWVEQMLYTEGGNTHGIAALVGAFSGAYNGLQVVDEEFYIVENFRLLCKLGLRFHPSNNNITP